MNSVPVIDISNWHDGDAPARADIANRVNEACRTWGFLIVSGHGVPSSLLDEVLDVTYRFFDMPEEDKLRISHEDRPGGRGYYTFGEKAAGRTRDPEAPGDLRETFFTGMEPVDGDPYFATPQARRHFAPNVWPDQPGDMKDIWTDYGNHCTVLTQTLMQIFAHALALPEDYFDKLIDRPINTLVALHYPALSTPPAPGRLRTGEHSDFSALTLLLTEDRPGGLQVMGLDGKWYDVTPVSGTFIINLGDLMARWTNDYWRSTLHRVVSPPPGAGSTARRLSLVYFLMPNHDTRIECIPTCLAPGERAIYPPIQAGQYLMDRLAQVDHLQQASPRPEPA